MPTPLYALGDIAAGEEITEDYGDYQISTVPFYATICAEFGVMTTDEIAQRYSSVIPFGDAISNMQRTSLILDRSTIYVVCNSNRYPQQGAPRSAARGAFTEATERGQRPFTIHTLPVSVPLFEGTSPLNSAS